MGERRKTEGAAEDPDGRRQTGCCLPGMERLGPRGSRKRYRKEK